ncbi:MAG: hypothetical protein C5B56_04705 [Proteobacteria bacterium]|nr:MAG: hypothetical protein C5B56_04705 [Pseudomonadota bacterium]
MDGALIRTALLLWPALILPSPASAQGRGQRLEHERLLREEASRALQARYEAASAVARDAAERGDWDSARAALSECLRSRPRDPWATRQTEEVSTQVAAIAVWNKQLSDVVAALEARNWPVAEQQIRQLPERPRSARPLPHAELVPVLHLYARGEWKEARRAASAIATQSGETAAGGLALLVNRRMREEWLFPSLAALAAIYFALLTASLYFGLRGAWRGTAAP